MSPRTSGALLLAAAALSLGVAPGISAVGQEPQSPPRDHAAGSYGGQSDDEARATARGKFHGLLDSPPLRWPPVHRAEQLRGYLSDRTAVVAEADGTRGLLESTLPLRGKTPTGKSAPIDLGLVDAGRSFAPKSSAAAIRIPRESAGALRFPDHSFGVRLGGAADQDASIQSN